MEMCREKKCCSRNILSETSKSKLPSQSNCGKLELEKDTKPPDRVSLSIACIVEALIERLLLKAVNLKLPK